MIRAVLDANVLVSAEIKLEGNSRQIVNRSVEFEWLTSEYILAELRRVLNRRHIQTKYRKQATVEAQNHYMTLIRERATIITVTSELDAVSKDIKDNPVLACAVDGKASYIVTGDNHLLGMVEFQGIKIVTPTSFLEILSKH